MRPSGRDPPWLRPELSRDVPVPEPRTAPLGRPACSRGAGHSAAGGELAGPAESGAGRSIDPFAFVTGAGDLKALLQADPLDADEQGGSPLLAPPAAEDVPMQKGTRCIKPAFQISCHCDPSHRPGTGDPQRTCHCGRPPGNAGNAYAASIDAGTGTVLSGSGIMAAHAIVPVPDFGAPLRKVPNQTSARAQLCLRGEKRGIPELQSRGG